MPSRSAKRNAEFIAEQEREEIQQRVLVLEEDLRQSLEKQETYQDDIAQLDASLRLKDQSIQELRLRMDGVRSSTDGNTLISRAGIEKVVRGLQAEIRAGKQLRSQLATALVRVEELIEEIRVLKDIPDRPPPPPRWTDAEIAAQDAAAEAAMREFAKDEDPDGVAKMMAALGFN